MTQHNLDSQFKSIADTVPVHIWASGSDKSVIYLNQEWLSYTGKPLEQQLGYGWESSIHPDDLPHCNSIYNEHFERCEPFEVEFRLERNDGQYRYFKGKGAPRFDTTGTFSGFSGYCMDVHDKHEINGLLDQKIVEDSQELQLTTEKLRQQVAFSEKIFNASVDVMIVYDR
ncbi:MAG: PAS domain S-box protein, partial [Sphingobacteriales bacterium]